MLYKAYAARSAFRGMNKLQAGIAAGDKDMFDVYLESVPFNLNNLALAFGEVYYIECYQRRIAKCTCPKTGEVFKNIGLLFACWNIVERAGDFRDGDLLSTDQIA
jgi:hypothetical protein